MPRKARAVAPAAQGGTTEPVHPGQDSAGRDGWDALRQIVHDNSAPAAARASAARTLAEIEGRLGRHAPPPPRATVTVDQLTRAELVAELERLRALVRPRSG